MKMVEYGKPVYLANNKQYEVIRPNQISVVDDGAIVGNAYLSDEVIEDMANKIMRKSLEEEALEKGYVEALDDPGVEEALMVPVDEIKYIPPFPENCPIDPKHHASGPAMDLTGEIKKVDVYRKADDEDIAVVPNGIIHEGEFISIKQIGEASLIGSQLCQIYKQETGKSLPSLKTSKF